MFRQFYGLVWIFLALCAEAEAPRGMTAVDMVEMPTRLYRNGSSRIS